MAFTDDDLKSLKEHIQGEPGVAWVGGRPSTVCSIKLLEALLARLEACERAALKLKTVLEQVTLSEMGGTPDLFYPASGWDIWDEDAEAALNEYQEWRKAAGK